MSARTTPVDAKRSSPDDQENSEVAREVGCALLGIQPTSGVSGAGAWLDAHYDPVASLYTFSTCMGKHLS